MAETFPESEVPGEAVVLQSMTLLATLQTAMDVREAVEGRRAGRDPSGQEPPEVTRPYLRVAEQELRELHLQLLAGHLLALRADEESLAASVRRFDLLMKLRRTERLLHGTHQRLLSLYPEVPEALVEAARTTHSVCAALLEAEEDTFLLRLPPLLRQINALASHLHRVLAARR